MTKKELTIGLEEELFLVESESGELCKQWPEPLWEICNQYYPDQIIREFLSGQVELISSPHQTIDALHQELYQLRQFLAKHAADFAAFEIDPGRLAMDSCPGGSITKPGLPPYP